MKAFLLSLAIVSQAALGMSQLPDGTFIGQGNWKANTEEKGDYAMEMTIADNKVCTRYEFNGPPESYCFQATFESNGFFKVEHGSGYCYDYQCHYQMQTRGGIIEETLTFVDDRFYRVGSKKFANSPKIVWQEAAMKQK